MKPQTITAVLCGLLSVLFIVSEGYGESAGNALSPSNHTWSASLYGGVQASDTIDDIVGFSADYDEDNYVAVAALAREVYRHDNLLGIEIEAQVGRHFGADLSHWEFAALGLARWHPFPWDEWLDTSFAFGAGLSYYTEVSAIEKERDDDAQRLLGALAFEMTFGLPRNPGWDLLVRIHHRSGMGGVIGEGGSNYVCLGMKYHF